MSAMGVASVINGWAGDIKRQTVIVTCATDDGADTLVATQCGLKEIIGVEPTGRYGTCNGITDLAAVSHVIYTTETGNLIAYDGTNADNGTITNTRIELWVYGK